MRIPPDGGAIISGLAIGTDVPELDYDYQYETLGIADPQMNLRLQSPNSIIFHTGNPPTARLTITQSGQLQVYEGGAIINGVAIGTDVPGLDYDYQYETLGIADPQMNLRLQSPNSIIFHTGNPPTARLTITQSGQLQAYGGGAIINGVAIGTDVPGLDYDYQYVKSYETIGAADPQMNLRLQSPNSIIFHTGNPPTEKLAITQAGDVGIGTLEPGSKLTVAGVIESISGGIKFPDGSVQTTATLRGERRPKGDRGERGPKGDKGDPGRDGRTGRTVAICGPNPCVTACPQGVAASSAGLCDITSDTGSCSAPATTPDPDSTFRQIRNYCCICRT